MKQDIDVSIIVPAKNTDRFIGECLQSLVDIDCTGFTYEVVVVDDASTDNTRSIVEEFCVNRSNFIVVDGPGVSLAAARNVGLEHAKGKYIGWVDSDDYVEPSMFRKLFEEVELSGADIVLCDYGFYPDKVAKKEKWFREIQGKVSEPRLVERNTQLWNKLFRSSFLTRVSFPSLLETCSYGACALLLILAEKITTLNEVLYWYRVGHASTSSAYSNVDKFADNVELTRAQQHVVKKLGLGQKWESYFEYRVVYSLLQYAFIAARNGEKAQYTRAVLELKDMNYGSNSYLSKILNENHGRARAFALSRLIPSSWTIARILGFLF